MGLSRVTPLRSIVALMLAAWLAAGSAGAYLYVERYNVYRGFPPPATPRGTARGTMQQVRFRSAAVGKPSRYLVYLPAGYARAAAHGRRFPVLYLLHGSPGKLTGFRDVGDVEVRANVLIAQHRMPPTVLVMPAGREGLRHGDTEWANTAAGRWEDYVIDVVRDVDHRFATLADRQHRGIAGNSEGGYAAVNISLHHLAVFSVAESWSGYYVQTPTGVFRQAPPALLAANSPAEYVRGVAPAIARDGLRVWLYQGRTDRAPATRIRDFSAALHRAGADVHYGFFPGGHDWGLWRAQLPRMLRAAARWFARRPGTKIGYGRVGRPLPAVQLRRILADRRRRCLAPHVHISASCRRTRARARDRPAPPPAGV